MRTVALDAMGCDRAPLAEVEGAIQAVREGGVRVLLVGDRAALEPELRRRDARGLPLEIRHAGQVITMQDHPATAIRRKRDASMRVAAELVRAGEADAVVSAGNSGAMLACGLFVLGRLSGVDRPAILITVPTRRGPAVLLDMGANVDCRPLHLAQFAVMGAAFAREMHGKPRPRVGILSNGAEDHKGTELTRESHRLLAAGPTTFEYAGYVEGRDVFSGDVDVVVCDGFSGNLVLKVTEGAAETLMTFIREAIQASWWSRLAALPLRQAFRRVKRRLDYAEQGGAPLLGVRGVSIICHGGSSPRAIKNAILGAERYVGGGLSAALERAVADHAPLIAAARGQQPATGSEPGGQSTRTAEIGPVVDPAPPRGEDRSQEGVPP